MASYQCSDTRHLTGSLGWTRRPCYPLKQLPPTPLKSSPLRQASGRTRASSSFAKCSQRPVADLSIFHLMTTAALHRQAFLSFFNCYPGCCVKTEHTQWNHSSFWFILPAVLGGIGTPWVTGLPFATWNFEEPLYVTRGWLGQTPVIVEVSLSILVMSPEVSSQPCMNKSSGNDAICCGYEVRRAIESCRHCDLLVALLLFFHEICCDPSWLVSCYSPDQARSWTWRCHINMYT